MDFYPLSKSCANDQRYYGRREGGRGGLKIEGEVPNQISRLSLLGTYFMAAQFGNGPQKCQLPMVLVLFQQTFQNVVNKASSVPNYHFLWGEGLRNVSSLLFSDVQAIFSQAIWPKILAETWQQKS